MTAVTRDATTKSGTNTDLNSPRDRINIHDIRVAFFHAPVEEETNVHMQRGVPCCDEHTAKAVHHVLNKVELVHLVVVRDTYFREACDLSW